jgi:hypothetical protein
MQVQDSLKNKNIKTKQQHIKIKINNIKKPNEINEAPTILGLGLFHCQTH